MRLTMKTRRELARDEAVRYRKASRKEKSVILTHFVRITSYNRSYAATLLRWYGTRVRDDSPNQPKQYTTAKKRRKGGGRPPKYPLVIKETVEWLWGLFGHKCGKLLVPLIRENFKSLENRLPISKLSKEECRLLRQISPATVDRMLQGHPDKQQIKGTSYTRSNSSLISQIPIRTFGEWQNVLPGEFQLDCVGHDGGLVSGQCCFTLTATDVYSGWCERRALLNRAHKWVIEALKEMREECPLPFTQIHPDNGSEFINHALIAYCGNSHLDFTRGRPGKKNDNCYVEQKNFDAVRKLIGYARYTTPEALFLLNEIYRIQGLLQNYIYPTYKLVEKKRRGARCSKKYDQPKAPAVRLLESPAVGESIKAAIREQRERIDPVALALEVANLQKKLIKNADRLDQPYPKVKEKVQ